MNDNFNENNGMKDPNQRPEFKTEQKNTDAQTQNRPYMNYQQNKETQTPPQNNIPYIPNPNHNNPITPVIPEVSTIEWLLSMLVACVPCVNIVVLAIWAFSKNTNPSKQNWAKATLILAGILLLLSIVSCSSILALSQQLYY